MSLTSTLFNPYSEPKILVFQPPYYLYFEFTLQVFKPHFSPNPSIFDWETLQRTNVLKDPLFNSVFFFGREKWKGSREKNPIFRDFAREKEKGSREKFWNLTKKWAWKAFFARENFDKYHPWKKTPCPWKIYTIFPAKMKTKCDFYLFLTREIDFSTREKNGKKGQN